jgi:hypothetical protein
MSAQLSDFEQQAMNTLLKGEDPILSTLRQQLKASRVAGREYTGVGFYTTFKVPDESQRVPQRKRFTIGDVVAEIKGLAHGAGFLLFVENGVLDFLEGFTYDEEWPTEVTEFRLQYTSGLSRDMDALKKQWL